VIVERTTLDVLSRNVELGHIQSYELSFRKCRGFSKESNKIVMMRDEQFAATVKSHDLNTYSAAKWCPQLQ
jgi:hypothetical protein